MTQLLGTYNIADISSTQHQRKKTKNEAMMVYTSGYPLSKQVRIGAPCSCSRIHARIHYVLTGDSDVNYGNFQLLYAKIHYGN